MTFWLFLASFGTIAVLLAACYRPLGDYMARTYTSEKDLRAERGFYRLIGVDPRAPQSWQAYMRGVLALSMVGLLLVYVLQRVQAALPYSLGHPNVSPGLAFNTAVSFVMNTAWQSYSGEAALGYTVQFAGLVVQNCISAAVGIAVAIALVRDFTLTSTGAVNAMHDSNAPLGGIITMVDMMLGEVAPGGAGSGLYGILVMAVVAVFLAGLMIGRMPEYLGKTIGAREMKLASLCFLTTPTLVLAVSALSFAIPAIAADAKSVSIANSGQHGFSEVLYAFTSAANNNGSAFAGLTADTP